MLACSSKDRQAGSQAVQILTALHVGCAQVLWRNCIWLWSCSLGRQESQGELQPCGRQLFTGAWQLPESSRAPMSSLFMFYSLLVAYLQQPPVLWLPLPANCCSYFLAMTALPQETVQAVSCCGSDCHAQREYSLSADRLVLHGHPPPNKSMQ